jgi:putative transposase
MRENGICSKIKLKWKATTDSNHNHPVAPNLLNQNFNVDAPDKAWASDMVNVQYKKKEKTILALIFSKRYTNFINNEKF